MAAQNSWTGGDVARGQVPHHRDAVRAGEEPAVVATDREVVVPRRQHEWVSRRLRRSQMPEARGAVTARRDDGLSVRAEDRRAKGAFMTSQHAARFAGGMPR